MSTLRDIKNRISAITSIEKITSAMKMVSSMKSRKAQKLAENARPYYKEIEKMLKHLINSSDFDFENPLVENKTDSFSNNSNLNSSFSNNETQNVVIIVIAGDKGMCGAFNSNIFKIVDKYLQSEFQEIYPNAKPNLILVGTKAVDYYKKKGYNILAEYNFPFNALEFSLVNEIRLNFIDDFFAGNVDKVEVFYNKFINVMKQVPTKFQLLPIPRNLGQENNSNEENVTENDVNSSIDYVYEPDKNQIFDKLIYQYLDLNIWGPLIESNAAEQAARLIAMDKATQNAQELIKDLGLQYNNARQSAITTEMLEIVSGAEALNK
jgi:F-type H+-transporting ATPase subunit gamma